MTLSLNFLWGLKLLFISIQWWAVITQSESIDVNNNSVQISQPSVIIEPVHETPWKTKYFYELFKVLLLPICTKNEYWRPSICWSVFEFIFILTKLLSSFFSFFWSFASCKQKKTSLSHNQLFTVLLKVVEDRRADSIKG